MPRQLAARNLLQKIRPQKNKRWFYCCKVELDIAKVPSMFVAAKVMQVLHSKLHICCCRHALCIDKYILPLDDLARQCPFVSFHTKKSSSAEDAGIKILSTFCLPSSPWRTSKRLAPLEIHSGLSQISCNTWTPTMTILGKAMHIIRCASWFPCVHKTHTHTHTLAHSCCHEPVIQSLNYRLSFTSHTQKWWNQQPDGGGSLIMSDYKCTLCQRSKLHYAVHSYMPRREKREGKAWPHRSVHTPTSMTLSEWDHNSLNVMTVDCQL